MAVHYEDRMTGSRTPAAEQTAMARCRGVTQETIRRYPIGVSLAVFGIGLGLGTLAGSLLAESCAVRDRRIAEGLGRRILSSLERAVPERLRR